jgi:hypothetical protein
MASNVVVSNIGRESAQIRPYSEDPNFKRSFAVRAQRSVAILICLFNAFSQNPRNFLIRNRFFIH